MAKVKARPDAAACAGYEQDFFAWTQDQARLLRARNPRGLDWDNVAEEIESMGRRDRRELESRLRLILHHLLKWQIQPELRSPSWRNSLTEQRRQAEKLLKESPSLRLQVSELRNEAYPDAVRDAIHETGLRPQSFPAACPFTVEQILDHRYLPADES
jgi:cell division protein FtsB